MDLENVVKPEVAETLNETAISDNKNTEETVEENAETVVETGAKDEDVQGADEVSEQGEAEESTDNSKRIQELEEKLAEAIKIGEKAISLAESVESMNADLSKKQSVIEEYESTLKSIVDNKVSQVPEQFKELIPENLSLKGKLEWLEKAESKGLFTTKVKSANPQVEVGKPMNVESPKVDADKLKASDLMRMAYNTIKG